MQNGKSTQPQNGKHAAPQNGKHPQPQNGKLLPPQNGKHTQLQNGKHKPLHPLGLQYPALWGRDQPFRDASPLTWGQAHSLPTGSGGTLQHLPEYCRNTDHALRPWELRPTAMTNLVSRLCAHKWLRCLSSDLGPGALPSLRLRWQSMADCCSFVCSVSYAELLVVGTKGAAHHSGLNDAVLWFRHCTVSLWTG